MSVLKVFARYDGRDYFAGSRCLPDALNHGRLRRRMTLRPDVTAAGLP